MRCDAAQFGWPHGAHGGWTWRNTNSGEVESGPTTSILLIYCSAWAFNISGIVEKTAGVLQVV